MGDIYAATTPLAGSPIQVSKFRLNAESSVSPEKSFTDIGSDQPTLIYRDIEVGSEEIFALISDGIGVVSVVAYPKEFDDGSSISPTRRISGNLTLLGAFPGDRTPAHIDIDEETGKIFVLMKFIGGSEILVFPISGNGNIAPDSVIIFTGRIISGSGPDTAVGFVLVEDGIIWITNFNRIVVTNRSGSVFKNFLTFGPANTNPDLQFILNQITGKVFATRGSRPDRAMIFISGFSFVPPVYAPWNAVAVMPFIIDNLPKGPIQISELQYDHTRLNPQQTITSNQDKGFAWANPNTFAYDEETGTLVIRYDDGSNVCHFTKWRV